MNAPLFTYDGKTYMTAEAVPMEHWRWPNFTPAELACKGSGKVRIDERSMDALQALRDRLGVPLVLNSAFRTVAHNKSQGGATNSMHLQARAFDVSMRGLDPAEFEAAARAVGFTGFGFYPRLPGGAHYFIHVDTGPAREWGTRFRKEPESRPLSAPPLSPYAVPPHLAPVVDAAETAIETLADRAFQWALGRWRW